jgi:hypothetical protein
MSVGSKPCGTSIADKDVPFATGSFEGTGPGVWIGVRPDRERIQLGGREHVLGGIV